MAAAGVSKATVYRHFADKAALFTALIQRIAVRTHFFHQQELPPLEEEPVVFLKRYATQVFDSITHNPQELAFFRIIIGESGRFPELGQEFVQNIEKPNIDFLMQYFATHPKLQLADPEVAARTLVGTLIHFVIVRDLLHGGNVLPIECDRFIDGLVSLIIHKNKSH
ncbi:MAG: TetR/AcrR family transcriptional regulator [Nostoc sp.]|uniref:TetR/AcrR family transcriptional regulator n=1 Tax=Nostoc sp. TaxID=1180 RepID=UPI002FEF5AE9